MLEQVAEIDLRWPRRFNAIPKAVFHRPDIYELELTRLFGGSEWHMVGHRAELSRPGDYKTAFLGTTPLLIVHGAEGRIRVFENSCTHRGVQLATCSRGHTTNFQCPYHRWNFNISGELTGAPGSAEFATSFQKADYGLRSVRSAEYLGIIFATANHATPALDDWLDDTKPYIAKALNGDGRLRFLGYQKASYDTNWKCYSDNEGYHGPLLHSALRLLQFPKAEGVQFMTKNAHKVNSSAYPGAPNSGYLQDYSILEARDAASPPQTTIVSLFPTSLIVRNLDALTLQYAYPLAVDRTEVHYAFFGHEEDDEALTLHRVRQGSNFAGPSGFVTLEDGAVFNRLQIGMHTGGTVEFQKGVKDGDPMTAPCVLDKGDEAGNLIRWERYRHIMGFARD